MRKISTISKFALGLFCLCGTSLAANAQDQGEAPLGQTITLTQSTYYTYTPESSGTLTATFTNDMPMYWDGSAIPETILFTQLNGDGGVDTPYNGDGYEVPMTIEAFSGMEVTKGSFKVKADQKYYLFANKDAMELTLSFVAGDGDDDDDDNNVIEEGKTFTAQNKWMVYTPEETGLLTITADTYAQYQWVQPSGQGLLFSEQNTDSKVTPEGYEDTTPVEITYVVKANTPYYLYQTLGDFTFTFELSPLPTPALKSLYPYAGQALDEGEHGNGVVLSFFPLNCSFTSASISYTTVSGQQFTKDLVEGPNSLEGDDYGRNMDGTWKFQAVTMAYFGFTPKAGTYADEEGIYWEAAEKGTPVVLTINGANFDGVPVTNNDTGSADGVKIENGTITLTWNKPDVDIALEGDPIWPTTLYDFNLPGEDMIATIAFNEPLSTLDGQQASASMVFGNQTYGAGSSGDNADPGMNLPCTVEGNKIFIDFAGIDFGALYNTQTAKTYSSITVFVANIYGVDGQKFVDENPGINHKINFVHQDPEGLTYMTEEPTMYYDADVMNPAIYIYWNESVSELSSAGIEATLTVPDEEGTSFQVPMVLTTFYPEMEEGQTVASDNALILPMAEYLAVYGAGEYSLSIGRVVWNEEEEINEPFEDSVQVTAVPVMTKTQPTFDYDNEDTITLNWNDETVALFNPYEAYILIVANEADENNEYADYQLSVGDGVSIVGNDVVIDLSELELTENMSYTLYIDPFYFYIGGEDYGNAQVMETFTYMESDEDEDDTPTTPPTDDPDDDNPPVGPGTGSVSSLEAEAAQGGIYNLNGVKVGNDLNKLAKGIYIINGKKVVVNK